MEKKKEYRNKEEWCWDASQVLELDAYRLGDQGLQMETVPLGFSLTRTSGQNTATSELLPYRDPRMSSPSFDKVPDVPLTQG